MKFQLIMHSWRLCKFNSEMDDKQLVLTKMTHILKRETKIYISNPIHEDSA